jgi:hypothetical protein
MNATFSPGSAAVVQLSLNNGRSLERRDIMKSLIATAALTFMFLSAGVVHSVGKNSIAARPAADQNVTVIHKNQAWPVIGAQAIEFCQAVRCMDA